MRKILFISLFVLGLIIPNINVKAVDVSNEEELRAAIEQGGNITLTQSIEVTQPLVIDKDVNISGGYHGIMMQGDNTLMTVNSGNVTFNDVYLYAGWNSEDYDIVKNQGTGLVVNGGSVNFNDAGIYGNVGIEVNGGTVTGSPDIYADEYNYDNNTYSSGKGMIVNGGNVELDNPKIYSGGTALTVNNGANVTLNGAEISSYEENGIEVNNGASVTLNDAGINSYEGNGIEVNGGTVTGNPEIYAGEYNENNETYSGGQGMIVNGGNVELDEPKIYSGGTALTVNNGANVSLTNKFYYIDINSYEGNGIEVNDESVVNINSEYMAVATIFGSTNAIYLNGGTANLNGFIGLGSSTEGKGIYINKGVNTVTGGDVLKLGKDFVFGYDYGTTPNFSIYVNPDIKELRVNDEKKFMELLDNKLNLGFCSDTYGGPSSQTEEERKATCSALGRYVNYDGAIESNELGKCTTVYINGVKQNEPDASCTPVAEDENTENNQGPQIVEVPSTSAYGSIIIIVLGIICVIVSAFVMRRVTKKTN